MKKPLLFIYAVVISVSAIAQTSHVLRPRADVQNLGKMSPDNLIQNQNVVPRITAKRVFPAGNHTTGGPVNIIPIGSSSNGLGNFYIGRTLLQYEPAINTVVLIHRTNSA